MSSQSVHRTYANLLKWHGKGFALWDPVAVDQMSPGSVGYFDSKGRWHRFMRDVRDALPLEQFSGTTESSLDGIEDFRVFTSQNIRHLGTNLSVAIE